MRETRVTVEKHAAFVAAQEGKDAQRDRWERQLRTDLEYAFCLLTFSLKKGGERTLLFCIVFVLSCGLGVRLNGLS